MATTPIDYTSRQATSTKTTGAELDDTLAQAVKMTADPTVNDDSSSGYHVNTIWINQTTGKVWFCTDNTTGAAVWIELTALGASGYTWSVKTANYTMVSGDAILADSTGGPFTPSLPASPSTGDKCFVSDGASAGSWGTNNVTVARNGSTIEGAASDYTLSIDKGWAEFVYDGTTWQVREPSYGLGHGQTWQDMTASRSAGTTYTNSTGRTITVYALCTSNVGSTYVVQGYVDGVLLDDYYAYKTSTAFKYTGKIIIPPGSTYKVTLTNSALTKWYELR